MICSMQLFYRITIFASLHGLPYVPQQLLMAPSRCFRMATSAFEDDFNKSHPLIALFCKVTITIFYAV
jgi:hypothetical protein